MKRKILSLILVFAMTVSLLTVGTGAVEPTYGDTAGHWAESSIERWSAYGIIQGSNGLFDPNGQLTCAQLATILAKLLKLPAAKDAGFTDNTADAWYYDAINRCAAAGILTGNGDGTVTPEAPITRERAMVMLARALGIEPVRKPDLTKYTDAAQVSAYAQGYVAALIEAGIVGGVTADELAPQDNINRASTVTILDRAISTYADEAGATVKADGKGIVLVVAENVKITNAPEGTKIVVADGATGLTVNGKSVSDDQTYIVPKTTTSSGSSSSGGHSHTHSYNETTHKCSCGAFAPAVVATIGNTNGYLTLKDAVAAVEDGGTIKLIKDAVGSSIGTYKTPKQADANGDPQIAAKGFTIDFGGHTYTINNPASGSEGYESQGIHLERTNSIIPNVTFLNGKIAVDAKNGKAITMLVQNYCNLTLIDMVVDGSNLSDAYYKIGNELVLGANYTLSNNSKDGAKTLIQNTEIIARSGENHVAFDSDKKSDVTVKGNSIIRGKFEVGNNASLVIIGGTFNSDPRTYVPEGYVATKSETEEIWTVGEGSTPLVAEINGVKYISLAKALAAAKNGDTVKLVGNISTDKGIEVAKKITLDMAEHTITSSVNQVFTVTGSGDLTITGNGTIAGPTEEAAKDLDSKAVLMVSGESAKLTVLNGTITAGGVGDCGMYGIYVADGGNVILGDANTKTGPTITTWFAAVGENNTTSPANITIYGGEYTAQAAPADSDWWAYFCAPVYASASGDINISGGTFNGYYGISSRYVNVGQNLNISGGTFNGSKSALFADTQTGTACDETRTIAITGGRFSSDPGAYVAEGYIAYQKDDGTYQVVKNAGTVNVSLSELNKIAITKGPKATGEKTSFTVDLGSERVAASDIAYSENNSGYTGKGVQIGSRSLNNYAAKPAKVGDYEFVIKGGTITSEATGYSSIDSYKDTSVYMLVPGNSNVTFEDVTFEGVLSFDIQKYTSPWSNLNSLTFKNCIFKGIIIGTCPASNVTFDHCKFMNYTNTSDANNSNPIWWREDTEGSGANANPIKTFTFVNNEVVGTRPLKIERIGKTISPTFTFKNNTFDISKQDGDTGTKNMAINIGMGENPNLPFTLIDEGNTISANTAALYTASLTGGSNWYKEEVPGMKVLDGNGNAKIITAMVWKTTTGETFELKSVD